MLATSFSKLLLELDPDGSSARLITRIFIALFIGYGLFTVFDIPQNYAIWLFLGIVNNLIALARAPKLYLFRYYIFSVGLMGLFVVIGSAVSVGADYFLPLVFFIAFLSGLTCMFGFSGKMIGALSFVAFALSASINSGVKNIEMFLITYAIVALCVYVVLFIVVPVPRERIIKSAKRRFYAFLGSLLKGELEIDSLKSREIIVGIKNSLCDRLPIECQTIIQKAIHLKNNVLMLIKYEKSGIKEVDEGMEEFSNRLILLFDALQKESLSEEFFLKFRQESKKLLELIESRSENSVHLAVASYIISEISAITESEYVK